MPEVYTVKGANCQGTGLMLWAQIVQPANRFQLLTFLCKRLNAYKDNYGY